MGLIREFGLVIVSILLFFSILIAGITASVTLSLTYDNVYPKISSIATEIIEVQIGKEEIINIILPYAGEYCDTHTETNLNFQGYQFIFPCSVVRAGYDNIINHSIEYLIGDFYYKEYDCDFAKCFAQSDIPLFLVSNHARMFWRGIYIKTLIASLILFGLSLLLTKRKSNALFIGGSLMLINSLIILTLEKIGKTFVKIVSLPLSIALSKEDLNNVLSQVVAMFFSESPRIFFWMAGCGLLLIAIGIIFRVTNLGFNIREKIEKIREKDNLDKEEKDIPKEKQKIKTPVKEELSKKEQFANKIKKK